MSAVSFLNIENPISTCVIAPLASDGNDTGFSLCIGPDVGQYTTPSFQLANYELRIKLKINRIPNCNAEGTAVQLILVEPVDDVFHIIVNGKSGHLTSDSRSFTVFETADSCITLGSTKLDSFTFDIFLSDGDDWRSKFSLFKSHAGNTVILRMGEKDLTVSEHLLTTCSAVFKAMFDRGTNEKQTGIIEIDDFPFEVVQEMIRFMDHGYCCLWATHWEELDAIADKYNVIHDSDETMKALADHKAMLNDQLF